MAYFDGIKVGDRVYDMRFGWGTVTRIGSDVDPITVDFKTQFQSFTIDGCWTPDEGQTLFWSKPEFIPPPRPKRVVKETIEQWINFYDDGTRSNALDSKSYADCASSAARADGKRRIACVKLTGSYEVEE